MKLVLVDGFYLGRGRGVGNYVHNLVQQFAAIQDPDIRIVIACTRDVPDLPPEAMPVEFLRLPRLPFPIWENVVMPLVSAWIRPDVIHFPANSSPLLPVSGRRIVTIHDAIFLHSRAIVPKSQVLRQRIGRMYLAMNVRLLAKHYRRILTVSECSKSDIQNALGLHPDRVIVIYEGPGLLFQSCSSPLESRRSILHFASGDPRKNTSRVIEAFRLSRAAQAGFTLHLVGSGFSRKGITPDIRDSVREHEFLPIDQLQLLVDETRLLLFPSLYEGFGMPIVEFQRLGIPVVTSNTSACAEIGARGAILVNPEDVSEIARGIDRLCDNSVIVAEKSEEAYENALRFQWASCAKSVLKEYAAS